MRTCLMRRQNAAATAGLLLLGFCLVALSDHPVGPPQATDFCGSWVGPVTGWDLWRLELRPDSTGMLLHSDSLIEAASTRTERLRAYRVTSWSWDTNRLALSLSIEPVGNVHPLYATNRTGLMGWRSFDLVIGEVSHDWSTTVRFYRERDLLQSLRKSRE